MTNIIRQLVMFNKALKTKLEAVPISVDGSNGAISHFGHSRAVHLSQQLKVLDIRKDLAVPGDIQPLLKLRNPLEVINVDVKLDLVETIHKKRDVAPSILRSLALETIEARYPATDCLHIFTDGSQFDCHFNVGAGVFSDLFSFYAPAGFIGTAFDGEVVAMCIALKQLLAIHHKFENAVLLPDSQAAIQSISSFELPLTPEISHCQELLRTLTLKGK
ncbi:hypothetical protein AVEN_202977-1 [Araneus ventricosus]|uniref:Uncharacterized protein n=1 Tax=Araneus ventricosus TaxID=182803 RepID=A0A4Y2FSG2_ARAVE|nr:hypothetical protein AVEN_202977-1 [Araneus ventricosus]